MSEELKEGLFAFLTISFILIIGYFDLRSVNKLKPSKKPRKKSK